MNGNNDSYGFGAAASAEAADAYVKFWSDFTSKIAAAAFTPPAASTPPDALREIRSAMLKAIADSCDQCMRSPQFQEAMQQWFGNSVRLRSQFNDWASRVRHEWQGVSRQDIDAVVQAIGRLESRVCDGLQAMSERLDALEGRGETPARPSRAAKSRQPRRTQRRKVKS